MEVFMYKRLRIVFSLSSSNMFDKSLKYFRKEGFLIDQDHDILYITSENPKYENYKKVLNKYGSSYMEDIIYSKEELEKALWLEIKPNNRTQYIQPESINKLKKDCFMHIGGCKNCHPKLKPLKPFRLKKSFRFVRRNSYGTHDSSSDFFISELFKSLLLKSELKGFDIWPVYNKSEKYELKDTYQIHIQEHLPFSMIDQDNIQKLKCPNCGNVFYKIPNCETAIEYHYEKENFKCLNNDIYYTKDYIGANDFLGRFSILISHKFYTFLKQYGFDKDFKFDIPVLE